MRALSWSLLLLFSATLFVAGCDTSGVNKTSTGMAPAPGEPKEPKGGGKGFKVPLGDKSGGGADS